MLQSKDFQEDGTVNGYRINSSLQFTNFRLQAGRLIMSDLRGGVWKPHAIATDILQQIESPVDARQTLNNAHSGEALANVIGGIIDEETRGTPSIRGAFERVETVIRATATDEEPLHVCVILPEVSVEWDLDNIYFVKFLTRAWKNQSHRLSFAITGTSAQKFPGVSILLDEDYESRHSEAPMRLVAKSHWGILSNECAEKLNARCVNAANRMIQLGNGWHLPPFLEDESTIPDEYMLREPLALGDASYWFDIYVATMYPSGRGTCNTLYSAGCRAYAEGSPLLGLRLLECAISKTSDVVLKLIIGSQLQGMRIGCERFIDAAREPLPSDENKIPEALLGFLSVSKAWGLVMSGQPHEAEPLFTNALGRMAQFGNTRTFLYLKNIYALNCLRLGDNERAFQLEGEIEAALRTGGTVEYHLEYINSLNTARLWRRVGNLPRARAYYRKAFDTAKGVWSESDLVFLNATYALCYEATKQQHLATVYWMRAALHWMAMRVPEALAPRVYRILLGRENEMQVDDLCKYFALKLRRSVGTTEATNATSERVPPRFLHVEHGDTHAVSTIIGQPGWAVGLAACADPMLPSNGSTSKVQLGRQLWEIIQNSAGTPLVDSQTVLVARYNGEDMCRTLADGVLWAYKLKADVLIWEGRRTTLAADELERFLSQRRVSIHPAVKSLRDGSESSTIVSYKRYLQPVEIDSRCSEIVTSCLPIQLSQLILRFGSDVHTVLEKLEEQKVLAIRPASSALAKHVSMKAEANRFPRRS